MKPARKICAVVPVKETRAAKQRLAGILTAEQRQLLVLAMFEDVLSALTQTAGLASVLVATVDRAVAGIARRYGADISDEAATEGHTEAVAAAATRLSALGFDMLTVPADIPLVQALDIRQVLSGHQGAADGEAWGFTIVPARDQRGSNAVFCSPAGAVPLRFGEDSFLPHLAAARTRGIEPMVLRLPHVALDIDTPEDLDLLLREQARTRTHVLLEAWSRVGSQALRL